MILLGASLLILIYVCGIGLKNVFRYNTFKLEHRALLDSVEKERAKQRQLIGQLAQLDSEAYWEMLAKKRLRMKKTGEVIYQFIEN